MKFKQEVMESIGQEIEALLPTVVQNDKDLDRAQKLMSIYASYTAIQLNQAQRDMIQNSTDFMKNVDMSQIDFNALLQTLKGG